MTLLDHPAPPPVDVGPAPAPRARAAARAPGRALLDAQTPAGRTSFRFAAAAGLGALAGALGQAYGLAGVAQHALEGSTGSWVDGQAALLIGGATALRVGCGWVASDRAAVGALRVQEELRDRLLRRMVSKQAPAGRPTGTVVSAVLDLVDRLGPYYRTYQPARVLACLGPLLVLAAVLPASWVSAVLLALAAPLIPLNMSVIGMGAQAVSARQVEQVRHLSGYFLDRLQGLATLRALGAERAETGRVDDAGRLLSRRTMAVLRVAFLSSAALEVVVTMGIAVVATYVGLSLLGYVHVAGLPATMSLRDGLFVLLAAPLFFAPLRTFAAAYHERSDALAAADVLVPLLGGDGTDEVPPESPAVPAPARRAAGVTLQGVTVRFPDREGSALEAVGLRVEPGELLAITGPSGAGKSTLLAAVLGRVHLAAGHVLVDGSGTAETARATAWLGQRPYLFPGSLRDNVLLGRPGAAPGDVERAVSAAGLDEVVSLLPDGLDHVIGERGWGLSGGQAHRVALARMFLLDAPLVLLDEPTAHLDAMAERAVVEAVRALCPRGTVLVATHSPALLAAADRVLHLDRGRVVPAVAPAPTPGPLPVGTPS